MKLKPIKRRSEKTGRFYTVMQPASEDKDLAKAQPHEVWTTKEGQQILIRDMDTRHVINTIALLERKAEGMLRALRLPFAQAAIAAFLREQCPQYETLRAEARKRL